MINIPGNQSIILYSNIGVQNLKNSIKDFLEICIRLNSNFNIFNTNSIFTILYCNFGMI